jgi:adenylate cyclase
MGEQTLKNIARPVRAFRVALHRPPGQPLPAPATLPLALPSKPSIAAMPLNNMGDDPEQEYFVDGLGEDVITSLSKIPGLFVIARNSTFAYKEKASNGSNASGACRGKRP